MISLAGEDIALAVKADLSFLQDPAWREKVLGVLLYGSQATGEAGPRSDIDLCIVAPTISLRVLLSLPTRLAGSEASAGDDAGRGKRAVPGDEADAGAQSIAKF